MHPARTKEPARLPSWPAVSIALLVTCAAVIQPAILTGFNLYLLLLTLIVWTISGEAFDRNLLRTITPFFLIIIAGLALGIHADRYLYLKDAWYASNPAVIICVGYVLYRCKPDVARGLRAFVIAGMLVSLIFLMRFALNPEVFLRPAVGVREVIGTGYYAPALAFTILCAYRGKWVKGLLLPRWLAVACFLICAAAMILCFSRTMLIVGAICLLAALGAFSRRELLRIGAVILISLLVLTALRVNVDVELNESRKSFVGKLARSMEEVRVQDYVTMKEINENWRGYETARALKLYLSGTPIQWIFGHGFGAQVDLGLAISLGGPPTRLIPILHNGYAYLLVKGGIFAILMFLFVLAQLYVVGRRKAAILNDHGQSAPGCVLQGIVISLVFTTWVVGGVFNKLDMFPFVLGAGFLLAALTHKQETPP